MGFFNNFLKKIKQSTRPRFIINSNINSLQILLNSNHDNYFTLDFDSMKIKNLNDSFIRSANSIKAENKTLGKLYIEYIDLDLEYSFNGNPKSHFEYFIKKHLRRNDVKVIDSYHNNFQEFSKYLIDFKHEIGIIHLNLGNDIELFILDMRGKLFNDLLEIYKVKNKNIYINDLETFDIEINSSLVEDNIIENFIEKQN